MRGGKGPACAIGLGLAFAGCCKGVLHCKWSIGRNSFGQIARSSTGAVLLNRVALSGETVDFQVVGGGTFDSGAVILIANNNSNGILGGWSTTKYLVERAMNAAGKKRLGLLGMRERLEMVGGNFSVESAPGQGTTIVAQIPPGKAGPISTDPTAYGVPGTDASTRAAGLFAGIFAKSAGSALAATNSLSAQSFVAP